MILGSMCDAFERAFVQRSAGCSQGQRLNDLVNQVDGTIAGNHPTERTPLTTPSDAPSHLQPGEQLEVEATTRQWWLI